MAHPIVTPMTVDAFLAWDTGADQRHELHDGRPQAMAPTTAAHQIVAWTLGALLGTALRARPRCTARPAADVRIPDRDDLWYQPDLAVTCARHDPDQIAVPDPILIVEVLSPSTENIDRKRKLPDYRLIPSLQEILLIDPSRLYAEVHRRLDDERWLVEILRTAEAILRLDSVAMSVSLQEVYDRVALDDGAEG